MPWLPHPHRPCLPGPASCAQPANCSGPEVWSVLLDSKSHSSYREYDIYVGQLVITSRATTTTRPQPAAWWRCPRARPSSPSGSPPRTARPTKTTLSPSTGPVRRNVGQGNRILILDEEQAGNFAADQSALTDFDTVRRMLGALLRWHSGFPAVPTFRMRLPWNVGRDYDDGMSFSIRSLHS